MPHFFCGYWVSELMFLLQSKQYTYRNISQAPMGQPIILWRLFCLYWKMISLYFWMLIAFFSFFLLFSLKKRKTIYIPFTFCFHFFLPSCPSLLSSSFCKAILLGSHWVAYTVPKLVIFLPHLPNIIIIALSYHAQEYLFLCNTTTLRWNLLQKLLILAHFITYIMQIWVYKYILYEYIVCVLQDMNMNLP